MKKEVDDLGVDKPEVGQKIYVPTRCSISNGSSDIRGGRATISEVRKSMSGGQMVWFIDVQEVPRGFNWSQFLMYDQEELKEQFEDQVACPNPGIDTPWIEEGDIVNGQVYKGDPIW